mgnify:CR=1 FL=1
MWELLQTVKALLQHQRTIGYAACLGEFLRFELIEQCANLLHWFIAEEEASLSLELLR